jgi:hypothetical protein
MKYLITRRLRTTYNDGSISVVKYRLRLFNQDHQAKFVVLRHLEIKRAEVAYQFLHIFLLFGTSCVLQRVLQQSSRRFKEMEVVHGKPINCHSQGSVKRTNQGLENITISWMLFIKSVVGSI